VPPPPDPPPTPEPSPDPGPPIPLDHDQEDDSPDGEAGPEPNEAGFDDPCKTPTPDELSVWEYWKRAWRNDDAKIDWGNRKDKRAKAIREALKLHSAADLMKCIRGYTHDTWRPRAEALSAHEPHVLFGEQLRFEQGIAFADIVDARERLGTRLRSPYATGRERWRN
jgi:hypothetical protein